MGVAGEEGGEEMLETAVGHPGVVGGGADAGLVEGEGGGGETEGLEGGEVLTEGVVVGEEGDRGGESAEDGERVRGG